jgi:hypothetical protein
VNEFKPLHEGPQDHGWAVQVDPMKPKLKPPGFNRLKLRCDILLSNSAFKFKLRRYTMEVNPLSPVILDLKAGAYTRPLSSST